MPHKRADDGNQWATWNAVEDHSLAGGWRYCQRLPILFDSVN
jgi:hypothetical protein